MAHGIRKGNGSSKLNLHGLENQGEAFAANHVLYLSLSAPLLAEGHHPLDACLDGVSSTSSVNLQNVGELTDSKKRAGCNRHREVQNRLQVLPTVSHVVDVSAGWL